MTAYYDTWREYLDFLKPTFGNRKNWMRFEWIMTRKRLELLYGMD
jgi:hypothetical protein